jgi:hypothetical protein
LLFVERWDGLRRNQNKGKLVMMAVPEMDRAVDAIIRVTADQLMQEHLRVKHTRAEQSGRLPLATECIAEDEATAGDPSSPSD